MQGSMETVALSAAGTHSLETPIFFMCTRHLLETPCSMQIPPEQGGGEKAEDGNVPMAVLSANSHKTFPDSAGRYHPIRLKHTPRQGRAGNQTFPESLL
jgi:hypothetical protein